MFTTAAKRQITFPLNWRKYKHHEVFENVSMFSAACSIMYYKLSHEFLIVHIIYCQNYSYFIFADIKVYGNLFYTNTTHYMHTEFGCLTKVILE